jgi:hypothetical protein
MSLGIIIVTCIGLIKGFSKLTLGIVVALDLALIIINYLFLFTTLNYVIQILGQDTINVINIIGEAMGLIMEVTGSLIPKFILYIVIYYFAVVSFGLINILQSSLPDMDIPK